MFTPQHKKVNNTLKKMMIEIEINKYYRGEASLISEIYDESVLFNDCKEWIKFKSLNKEPRKKKRHII